MISHYFFKIIVVMGIHCDIYKSSYNISNICLLFIIAFCHILKFSVVLFRNVQWFLLERNKAEKWYIVLQSQFHQWSKVKYDGKPRGIWLVGEDKVILIWNNSFRFDLIKSCLCTKIWKVKNLICFLLHLKYAWESFSPF
jgi:hypothetical protein